MHDQYRNDAPSSRMTLSPKTMTSNSPLGWSRVRIFRLGLLRALASSAHTPILPIRGAFADRSVSMPSIRGSPVCGSNERSASLALLAAVLPLNLRAARLEERGSLDTQFVLRPSGRTSLRRVVDCETRISSRISRLPGTYSGIIMLRKLTSRNSRSAARHVNNRRRTRRAPGRTFPVSRPVTSAGRGGRAERAERGTGDPPRRRALPRRGLVSWAVFSHQDAREDGVGSYLLRR